MWAAPQASAATNAAVLNWTGLKDSYGVPIGDYCLAIASIPEQISQAGPERGLGSGQLGEMEPARDGGDRRQSDHGHILTAEAGFFIGVIAVALWIMKITVSTYWLAVIGEIARAITGGVIHVTTGLGLLAAVSRSVCSPGWSRSDAVKPAAARLMILAALAHAGAVGGAVRRSGRRNVWAATGFWPSAAGGIFRRAGRHDPGERWPGPA